MLSRIALMMDIPGDRWSSEYTASLARFQIKRLSGHLYLLKDGELCQYIIVWAYKHASSAGEIRVLSS